MKLFFIGTFCDSFSSLCFGPHGNVTESLARVDYVRLEISAMKS